jgi:hypothetical protein
LIVAHGHPALAILTYNEPIDRQLSPTVTTLNQPQKKKPLEFSRGLVILVGRARFELATNGLKEVMSLQNPM